MRTASIAALRSVLVGMSASSWGSATSSMKSMRCGAQDPNSDPDPESEPESERGGPAAAAAASSRSNSSCGEGKVEHARSCNYIQDFKARLVCGIRDTTSEADRIPRVAEVPSAYHSCLIGQGKLLQPVGHAPASPRRLSSLIVLACVSTACMDASTVLHCRGVASPSHACWLPVPSTQDTALASSADTKTSGAFGRSVTAAPSTGYGYRAHSTHLQAALRLPDLSQMRLRQPPQRLVSWDDTSTSPLSPTAARSHYP